ncbi:MAG: hypothetical protein QOI13_3355 [Paraburkholderia sp.]|nr:hypothetical protein [Paraburkholderia sp.]
MSSLLRASHLLTEVAVPHPVANPIIANLSQGLTERSLFHQPWWLDITAGNRWGVVEVANGNEVIAEMPYMLHRKGPWLLSTQPPLTRTLGPIIKTPTMSCDQERRYSLTDELISKLPRCALFQQTFDTRIGDAAAFSNHHFSVSMSFTLTIPPERDEKEIWAHMRANTRNVIRRAEKRVMVTEIATASEFVDFYDANLIHRKLHNVYGSQLMRRLIDEAMRRKAGIMLGALADGKTLSAAVTLVWDHSTLYYLLSTRSAQAPSGCVALLIWRAIKFARERNLLFDFDGIANSQVLTFLSGFGGTPAQRLMVERCRLDYAALRAMRDYARCKCRI